MSIGRVAAGSVLLRLPPAPSCVSVLIPVARHRDDGDSNRLGGYRADAAAVAGVGVEHLSPGADSC